MNDESDSKIYKEAQHCDRNYWIEVEAKPKIPLTKEQKLYLTDLYLAKFVNIYKQALIASNFVSDYELVIGEHNLEKETKFNSEELYNDDLGQEGIIVFELRVLGKFDLDGLNLSDKNYYGKDAPKTLEFFFWAYCVKMRNWMVQSYYRKGRLGRVPSLSKPATAYTSGVVESGNDLDENIERVEADHVIETLLDKYQGSLKINPSQRRNFKRFMLLSTIFSKDKEVLQIEFKDEYSLFKKEFLYFKKRVRFDNENSGSSAA